MQLGCWKVPQFFTECMSTNAIVNFLLHNEAKLNSNPNLFNLFEFPSETLQTSVSTRLYLFLVCNNHKQKIKVKSEILLRNRVSCYCSYLLEVFSYLILKCYRHTMYPKSFRINANFIFTHNNMVCYPIYRFKTIHAYVHKILHLWLFIYNKTESLEHRRTVGCLSLFIDATYNKNLSAEIKDCMFNLASFTYSTYESISNCTSLEISFNRTSKSFNYLFISLPGYGMISRQKFSSNLIYSKI